MNAVQRPETRPRPSQGIATPSAMLTPRMIRSMANAWPTNAAQRVALARSRVAAHSAARSTRPPSSGYAGIRLKTPSMMLIGPSHSRTVANGPTR